jgi:hypothetical protein
MNRLFDDPRIVFHTFPEFHHFHTILDEEWNRYFFDDLFLDVDWHLTKLDLWNFLD